MPLRIEHERKILEQRITKLSYFTKQPKLGFGVAQDLPHRVSDVSAYVEGALKAGFRHIDTSNYYGTESYVAKGIKSSGLSRSELFVTAKYMPDRKMCEMNFDSTIRSFNMTMSELSLEYVDLYLVHIPGFTGAQLRKCKQKVKNFNIRITNRERRRAVWKAMETIYKEGRTRAIGVSNFSPHHLDDIIEAGEVLPVLNQIQFNPFHHNEDWWVHNSAAGIKLSSFSSARKFFAENMESPRMKVIEKLAMKYGKSPLQIFQRWIIDRGVNLLTSSTSYVHQQENLRILDFSMDRSDVEVLSALEQDEEEGLHIRVD